MTEFHYGSDPSFDGLSGPKEWGREDRLLEVLRGACPMVAAAREQLRDSLEVVMEDLRLDFGSDREWKLKIAQCTSQLIEDIGNLPNHDYRAMAGMLNLARSKSADLDLEQGIANLIEQRISPTTAQIVTRLGVIHESRSRLLDNIGTSPDVLGREAASDMMLLLRTVYHQGVNMKTPDWAGIQGIELPDDHPDIFYNPNKAISIKRVSSRNASPSAETVAGVGGPRIDSKVYDEIQIRPMKGSEDQSEILYFAPDLSSSINPPERLGVIGENESMVIGRTLWFQRLFDLRREDRKLLAGVKTEGAIDNLYYSRGGLMVLRLNGIFIFNRGVVSHFEVKAHDGDGSLHTDFSGDSIVDDDGTFSFGHSRTFRPKDKKPGPDEDPDSEGSSRK